MNSISAPDPFTMSASVKSARNSVKKSREDKRTSLKDSKSVAPANTTADNAVESRAARDRGHAVDDDDNQSGEEYTSDNEDESEVAVDNVDIDDEHVGEDYLDDDDDDAGGFDEELDDAWRTLEEDDDTIIETIVPVNERVTSDRLTRYEAVELISIRSNAIERGAQCYVDTTGIRDRVEMAKKELYANRCPLLVKRNVGLGYVEVWDPNTMSKPLL